MNKYIAVQYDIDHPVRIVTNMGLTSGKNPRVWTGSINPTFRAFDKISTLRKWACGGYDIFSTEGVKLLSSIYIMNLETNSFVPLDEQFGFKLKDEDKVRLTSGVLADFTSHGELWGYDV